MKITSPLLLVVTLAFITGGCGYLPPLSYKQNLAKPKFIKKRKVTFEQGMAGLIDIGQYKQKYQALHRTAPIGSSVIVTNLSNDKQVVVNVVGKLPKGTPDNVVINLTQEAFAQIAAANNTLIRLDYEKRD